MDSRRQYTRRLSDFLETLGAGLRIQNKEYRKKESLLSNF
jgi:hypothetical protein